MYVPTIDTSGLRDEEDFREALIRKQRELREFREKSKPELRTPELWNLFYQLQAEASWLEESLTRIQQSRGMSGPKKKKQETRWEKVTRRKREEDDDE